MASEKELVHTSTISAYFHVPFCSRKCNYCSFYSEVGHSAADMIQETVRTLGSFSFFHHALGAPAVETVYIGGGTPSVLDRRSLDMLLKGIRTIVGDTPREWTVEANPESADDDFLRSLAAAGAGRLSLGVQSFHPASRSVLGRREPGEGLANSLAGIRGSWRGDLSFDLICCLPGQTPAMALADLEQAAAYEPEHLSVYTLSVEGGTPLESSVRQGAVALPEENRAEDIWFSLLDRLASLGYERYEVSNFSRPGKQSLHNRAYWALKPYTGCGPTAVSTLPGTRRPLRFTAGRDGTMETEELDPADFLIDYLLMGLRTVEGISQGECTHIFGPEALEPLEGLIKDMADDGFLERDPTGLRMTARGLDLLDCFLRKAARIIRKNPPGKVSWPFQ